MAEKGVWWSLQPFLDDRTRRPSPKARRTAAKQLEMFGGTDTAYALAKKYKIKTAWGTDTLFDAAVAAAQGAQLAKMVRWYTPAEALRMATRGQRRAARPVRPAQPLPGQARRRRRKARWPTCCSSTATRWRTSS